MCQKLRTLWTTGRGGQIYNYGTLESLSVCQKLWTLRTTAVCIPAVRIPAVRTPAVRIPAVCIPAQKCQTGDWEPHQNVITSQTGKWEPH